MVDPRAPLHSSRLDPPRADPPQCRPGDPQAASTAECAGGPPSIESLVLEHHAVLYRYAYRLTGRVQDAEDLVQLTFLAAQQKLDQLRSGETARAWLFTILRNAYLKARSKAGAATQTGLDMDLSMLVDLSVLVQPLASQPIDREELQQALDELPDEYRLVVVMFYFEEVSYKQIAERLELPIGTVMSRLSRAKACLRKRLVQDEVCAPVRETPTVAKAARS
jgi:RNA polymerase sigma-70 factor, ECF subfamily